MEKSESTRTRLRAPIELRGLQVRNRAMVAPMTQASAVDDAMTDWHLVRPGRFTVGGADIVFTEEIEVETRGRKSHGGADLWSDAQIGPLARIAAFLKANGAVPAIQLGYSGRKSEVKRPWVGFGPLDQDDNAKGETPRQPIGPSPVALGEGSQVPREMTPADIATVQEAWRQAARRALGAGFEVAEVHGAHGYLIHQFLSPLVNQRTTPTATSGAGACASRWRCRRLCAPSGRTAGRCSSGSPRWTISRAAGISRTLSPWRASSSASAST